MKILWITNVLLPPACEKLGKLAPISGGWLHSSALMLSQCPNVELAVVSPNNSKSFEKLVVDEVLYFCMPISVGVGKWVGPLAKYWDCILDEFKPDVVHLHGTEFTLGFSFVQYYGKRNVVVSIQGLTGVIAKYYLSNIDYGTILKCVTIRDFFCGGILSERKSFLKGGRYEEELLKNIDHVIGRTNWDYSHVKAINPNINYHFCNETLRDSFSNVCWSYDNCKPYTIFLSQCNYPIKGLHIFLKALDIVKRRYPEVKVRIAGKDFVNAKGVYQYLKRRTYGNILYKQLKQYNLEDNIEFLGVLNEERMCKELLSANVFVCPSSIENSSNSIGEAQMVGVPVIASYVGGTPDLIPDSSCGYLFRFEEYEMLAAQILKVFENSEAFDNNNMRKVARERHDKKTNFEQLMSIYRLIVDEVK